MIELLKQEVKTHGDRLVLIPIERLQSVKEEIHIFKESEELNGFQRWIVDEMYQFVVPEVGFEVKSILLVALSHPSYAEVEFTWQGVVHKTYSHVIPDFDKALQKFTDHLEARHYHISSASNLPLKRLAVQSGLARYGRNNVTYIEGMGSNFSYAAYFTDIPCVMDEWGAIRHAGTCNNCKLCMNNCPTGAIRPERFLIDNQRCLSAMNEEPGEFPEWLPTSVHHCLYDCMRCQIICPMNITFKEDVLRTVVFSEQETGLLLEGAPYDTFSDSLRGRTKLLGLDQWLAAIPRNLKILLERGDQTLLK